MKTIRLASFGVAAIALVATVACTSGPSGTYSDAMGSCLLELKSGHKANFTFSGDVLDCTFSTSAKKLSLTCKGDATPTVFTIHDDGSLTGPPGSFIPVLRKQKS
jgi:hypothetical protein